jgi:molecular chaperone GrpE
LAHDKHREKKDTAPGDREELEFEGPVLELPAADAESASPSAAQVVILQAEKEELVKTLVRRQADFENFRKRLERESQESGHRAVSRLIEDLLPILDAFERAMAAHDDPAYEEYRKGFELIYRQLWETLTRQGLERLNPEGEAFNPHVHQAVERVESTEHADGTVVGVLQSGYAFRGRVLRPATVRVAVHPTEQSEDAGRQVN